MFNDLIKNSSYDVFIPSLQDYIKFKPLNILQYKKIIANSYNNNLLSLGFKSTLFEILEDNKSTSNFVPTEFDLYTYGLYVRYYDISNYYKGYEIVLKKPTNYTTADNSAIKFYIPSIQEFFEYVEYINNLESKTENSLLIGELAKYADFKQHTFLEKIQKIKTFSINDINNHLKNIDTYKQAIKDLLRVDSIYLPFNSALILE
jgi:hypothetical protein